MSVRMGVHLLGKENASDYCVCVRERRLLLLKGDREPLSCQLVAEVPRFW